VFSFVFDLSIFAQRSIWEINLFSIICTFSAIFDLLGEKVGLGGKEEKGGGRVLRIPKGKVKIFVTGKRRRKVIF